MIFNQTYKNDIIDRPVKYGTGFSLPDQAEYRRAKAEVGERIFSPEELRQILFAAKTAMKAMVLLGANTALETAT